MASLSHFGIKAKPKIPCFKLTGLECWPCMWVIYLSQLHQRTFSVYSRRTICEYWAPIDFLHTEAYLLVFMSSDEIDTPSDPHKGKPAGHAFVILCNVLEARCAISELSRKEIRGYRVSIRYANQQHSASHKQERAGIRNLHFEGIRNKKTSRSAARFQKLLNGQALRL